MSENTTQRPTVEQINATMSANSPFHGLMPIELLRIDDDSADCRLELRPEFFHGGGFLHGGITYALADAVVAYLVLWRAGFDRKAFTIEGKLNYLASVPMGTEGHIRAKARAVSFGRTTAVVDADVYNDEDRLLCHGIFTYAIR